jgi:putative GTP pyrophosphokinase
MISNVRPLMSQRDPLERAIEAYRSRRHEFEIFLDGVSQLFEKHPKLTQEPIPAVHSIRKRLKHEEHLRGKIIRKRSDGQDVDESNLFAVITDLAGVRVLHLCQPQFQLIHEVIQEKVETRDWILYEQPLAYTWDPESVEFFRRFDLRVERKESFYTSIHYVVKPRADSHLSCEIQVRTLFEELWGEIDHSLNYPNQSGDIGCQEQLRVLAKLVGAGSRLTDCLFRLYVAKGQLLERPVTRPDARGFDSNHHAPAIASR